MILTLDQMASRYGMLPSRIMSDATTFDLVIMDSAMAYQSYLQEKDQPDYVPEVPVEELIKIRASVG